jgi:hypothetical protein
MAGFKFLKNKECAYLDQQIHINGARCAAYTGVKFGVRTDKAHIFSEGDGPVSIQTGNREPTGTLTLRQSAVDTLNLAAVAAGGRDLTDLVVDLVVVYRLQGVRGLRRMILKGVEFTAFEYGMMQNDKDAQIALPFLYMDLLFA